MIAKTKVKSTSIVKTKDLNFVVMLAIASVATALVPLLFFLKVTILGFPAWLVLLPLPVYAWPPAIHRTLHRDETIFSMMERLVAGSKVLEWPGRWCNEMVNLYYVGLPVSAMLGMALMMMYPLASPAGGAIVLVTYFLPWMRYMDIRSTLKRQVELELPVVSLLMWGLSEIGYDVMRIINALRKETSELVAIPREFAKIHRDFTTFNLSPDEAVLRETDNHPSKLFERLLGGAITISSIGGELSVHLSRTTQEILAWMKETWEAYGRAVSNLGELSMLFLLMVPLVAIWFGIVQGNATYGVDMVTYFLVPLIGASLYFYVSLQAPLDKVPARGNLKKGLVGLAVGVGIDAFLLFKGIQYEWLLLALPIMGFSLGYGYSAQRAIQRKNSIEAHMAVFVRSIGEHIRTTGDNLFTAISKLIGNKGFGKEINMMLKRYLILSTVEEEPVPESESWMGKTIFEIMVKADREGVLRYDIMKRLAEFADSYYDAILAKRRGLYMFLGSAIASPLILVAMIALTYFVLNQISSLAQIPAIQQTPGVQFPPQAQALLQFFSVFQNVGQVIQSMIPGLEVAIVETGIIYGILLAKGYDGTVRNTFRIFELMVVSVIAVMIFQFIVLKII
ncbi:MULTISPECIES: hypothetical protein [Metallosphaera]|uniref:Type II secretion system protein n=3 Tax=Metallosphaera TaxID=41980 RepID=A4YG07_METS5|nr:MULTISPECIES: hypothetical protein [Metallosphaera]ABP95359.1 type II secretion system protein [Metallosphaera sedula DSM 5348]AIM27345.1 type II secretion system protein [Metallosphaera sedula]AKV74225.1 secretion system protein [Metallosphaera sedula]AKV76464.1 secretion system protein [Metallosphaera sedula]AKV78716.1 secretion system protein [Metallosphaera sedula]